MVSASDMVKGKFFSKVLTIRRIYNIEMVKGSQRVIYGFIKKRNSSTRHDIFYFYRSLTEVLV